MLKNCAQFLGLLKHKTTRKKEYGGALTLPMQSKDIFVRIVHPGGREELYQNAVSASRLLEKYPGMCVARPQVFKNPRQAFLLPDEKLLPGHKYYMIPSSTAQKMKRSHQKGRVKRVAQGQEDARLTWDASEDLSDESVRSAKEFYVSKERWSGWIYKKKRPFVPPLPKGKLCYGFEWEPSLTSVQELSP